jgi:hypothetical protein
MAVEYVRSSEMDDDIVREWNQMAALVNELKSDFNALLTKLDADAGVTDTNYSSLRSITSADVDTFYLGY